MKAFAVFTRHEPTEIAWIERGYVFVKGPDGRTMFAGMESPAGGVVCLRLKCGGALGDMAASRAAELGGFVHEFDNGRPDFPEDAEAYDALDAHEAALTPIR